MIPDSFPFVSLYSEDGGRNMELNIFIRMNKIYGWKESMIDLNSKEFIELKYNIEKNGQKEPISVKIETKDGNNINFEGVDGKHRYIAMKQLGYKFIACVI